MLIVFIFSTYSKTLARCFLTKFIQVVLDAILHMTERVFLGNSVHSRCTTPISTKRRSKRPRMWSMPDIKGGSFVDIFKRVAIDNFRGYST